MPDALSMVFLLDSKGAKACKSCRSRQELSNEYLLAKFGVDTAENEPLKVLLIIQPWDLLFTEPPRPTAPFVRPGRLRLPLCSAGDGHIGFATALDFLPKSNVRFKAQTLSECGAHRKKQGGTMWARSRLVKIPPKKLLALWFRVCRSVHFVKLSI